MVEILIDEAGSFAVENAAEGSWCISAGYACPETEKRNYKKVIRDLKFSEKRNVAEEIKLHQLSEQNLIRFLRDLGELKGVLFCIATDSYLNKLELVRKHQKAQVGSILLNVDGMKYQEGKDSLIYLADQLEKLPAQLYVQLCCQVQLMHAFVHRGINYFVQRQPNTLKAFRWRVDQKEPLKKTDYEDAFEKFSPALLQSFSFKEAIPSLEWCDYGPMSEFLYRKGEIPQYLIEKLPHLVDSEAFDIQKIIRKDIQFIDSKQSEGIQIVDLLASAMRRLLKGGFKDNKVVAESLGRLMVQDMQNQPPVKLVTFGQELDVGGEAAKMAQILSKYSRPMLKNIS